MRVSNILIFASFGRNRWVGHTTVAFHFLYASRMSLRLLVILFAIAASTATAATIPHDCRGSTWFVDLGVTRKNINVHHGQTDGACIVKLYASSTDGDPWISPHNLRLSQRPLHGVVDAQAFESQRILTYQPEPGYVGADHFVVEVELHQLSVVTPATLNIDVEVEGFLQTFWERALRDRSVFRVRRWLFWLEMSLVRNSLIRPIVDWF
ncbi:MAG: hypothetical protein ACLPNY_08765 [Roseiarcus sp.]